MVRFAFKSLIILVLLALGKFSGAQNLISKLDDIHPVSPNSFQFLKYDQMPVSEYTGVPSINIPLYEIRDDAVSIPLSLSYHAGGIRVNQEASWVGLGWDLTVGSIVQTINDKDDFGNSPLYPFSPYIKKLPDYYNGPIPSEFPLKYSYPNSICNYGCNGLIPINTPVAQHGFKITTDNYVPYNGTYEQQNFLVNSDNYDTEPDIFTANFLGHSIKFMVDFTYGGIVLLNNKGYQITQINGNWIIRTPNGEDMYFEAKSIAKSFSNSQSLLDLNGSSSPETISSVTWFLTKIITQNKHQILINYSATAENNVYPTLSQKMQKPVLSSSSTMTLESFPKFRGNYGVNILATERVLNSYSYSKESYQYISSIVFPKGRVDFTLTDRIDLAGAKKLDRVDISSSQIIKSVLFNYAYADASLVAGNGFLTPQGVENVMGANYRLILNSVDQGGGNIHSFNYNSTALPKKNSFAQDYWGFYNGQLSNTSLVPNPAMFNNTVLSNNGDNHSSNLAYAQALTLEDITYPTGGKTHFDYELNTFDNYWVPNFSSSNNTISNGNGLRISLVTFKTDENTISKRTRYTYTGGKSILTKIFFRSFFENTINSISSNSVENKYYTIYEVNGNGLFSPSIFGSINGVGYDKVTIEDLDLNNIAKGKTEKLFFNNPDIVTNSSVTVSQFGQNSVTLPSFKKIDQPENGTLASELQYDNQNNLLHKVENSYSLRSVSIYGEPIKVYYGARVFSHSSYLFWNYNSVNQGYELNSLQQKLIGYYPIFDFKTVLTNSVETSYSSGTPLVNTTNFSYDLLDRPTAITKTSSENVFQKTTNQFADNYNSPLLYSSNRLNDVLTTQTYKGGDELSFQQFPISKEQKEYSQLGDKILLTKESKIERVQPFNNKPYEIFFDQYDSITGNLLQYTYNGAPRSSIWDYNKQYIVAEILNATQSDIAFNGFEADGNGNFTGIIAAQCQNILQAPEGKRYYALNNSSITKMALNPAKIYIVSYWSNSGVMAVTGTSLSIAQGVTKNGWTYYEHQVTNTNSIVISGNGNIDELRLYPKGSSITTYTYEPLIGITSKSDANGNITYFEYDSFGRLKIARNQDRNIVKQYSYSYQSSTNTVPSWQPTGATRCKPCPQNPSYITNILQQQERDNNSESGSYNQYRWTDLGPSPGCDINAVWKYTGTAVRCKIDALGQNTGEQEQEQQDANPCSSTFNQIKWVVIGVNNTICPIPPPSCNNGNCSGEGKKCINNLCETGLKVFTLQRLNKSTHIWTCVYHYLWSDHSISSDYTIYSSNGCF